MTEISTESIELCTRVDSLLEQAAKGPDGFYDTPASIKESLKVVESKPAQQALTVSQRKDV